VSYVAEAFAVHRRQVLVNVCIEPARAVSYAAPAPAVITAPAPVVEYIATTPVVSYVAQFQTFAVRHVSASRFVRGTSSVYAPYLRVLSSICVHCASTRGGVHRASTSRNYGLSIRGRVHYDRACFVIRGGSSYRVEYIAPEFSVFARPAPVSSTLRLLRWSTSRQRQP